MKLTKIHRTLKFKQSDGMKKYVNFNTKKETNAANSFEKNSFKLIINSAHGKTIENLRKRINVRLVSNEKRCFKYISKQSLRLLTKSLTTTILIFIRLIQF